MKLARTLRHRASIILLVACVLFLWMFFAADPLEQLGDAARFHPVSGSVRELTYRYAAEWRHGMAGNSPLYMPGFFAVAIAVWHWARSRTWRSMVAEGSRVLLVAIVAAQLIVPARGDRVVRSFERTFAFQRAGDLPAPSLQTMAVAVYTLITWSVFVVACQRALTCRSLQPFWPIPLMTAVLIAIRPWTVGDFSAMWWTRLNQGDDVAILSFIAIFAVSAHLIQTSRSGRQMPSDSGLQSPARARSPESGA